MELWSNCTGCEEFVQLTFSQDRIERDAIMTKLYEVEDNLVDLRIDDDSLCVKIRYHTLLGNTNLWPILSEYKPVVTMNEELKRYRAAGSTSMIYRLQIFDLKRKMFNHYRHVVIQTREHGKFSNRPILEITLN